MKYDVACIADIHWDALDPSKQYRQLQFFNSFIYHVKHLDLVVIAGDLFDTKILLNSRTSLLAIKWMNELVNICRDRNVKIRIIKGTNSHDNNQLDAFDGFDDGSGFFRIFRETTVEDTLPDFHCIYCPDEVMTNEEYEEKYAEYLYKDQYDAMFFHGSFDVVVPNISLQESEITGLKSIAFKYSHWSHIARVMIGGHWHDGSDNEKEHMYYTRSFSCWCFGEMNPKGFIYLTYDTKTKGYNLQRVENPFADHYLTYHIDTKSIQTNDDYVGFINAIRDRLESESMCNIRALIHVTDDRPLVQNAIEVIRSSFLNERRVKIVLRNDMKEEAKKDEKKKTDAIKEKYGFVIDRTLSPAEKIQKFILLTKNEEVPLDDINSYVSKYLQKT